MNKFIKRFFSGTLAAALILPLLAGFSFGQEKVSVLGLLKQKAGSVSVAVPAVSAAAVMPADLVARQYGYGRRVDPFAPGKAIAPTIYDPVKLRAITEVMGRIYYNQQHPFERDGIVFQNKEGILPPQPMGYYHEYTVISPGRPAGPYPVRIGDKEYTVSEMRGQRGPERIITGGREHIYYTPDHYRTFIELFIVH